MKPLGPLAGKTILIIGEADFLSYDARGALIAYEASVTGPIVASGAMVCLSEGLMFDAVIIDVAISDDAMLWMNDWLEPRKIPFIFARDQQSAGLSGGFVLSGRPADIDAIVFALFGQERPFYH
ncbi:hypothetical protein [Rhizobium hidalgonense]|uniref:hypothetical protein n=1 Tax=Rhizobium hidalgonense TaxID=1538159 RepID=UPI0011072FCE|nr:hypothetical protein [Rhizobium hidalgonense]QKK26801.1 hypothetical protein FFM81_026170 [Rhizobium hidalgonense]